MIVNSGQGKGERGIRGDWCRIFHPGYLFSSKGKADKEKPSTMNNNEQLPVSFAIG